MLKAFQQALPQAMPAKQCRQDKTRLLTQQQLKLGVYLTVCNAHRGGSKKSLQRVTAKHAAATRQAVNHA